MMQSVTTHETNHHQLSSNSANPHQDVVVVYINDQVGSGLPPTNSVNPIVFEKKQRHMMAIASFFLSFFFFLLVASLSLYIVFIFVLNFKTGGDNDSVEQRNFTNLYGWPLWILVISLTLFMISLIMFVHRYRAYSIAVRRKALYMSRQVREIGMNHPQDESNVSITTEKPTDPSTIALFDNSAKTQSTHGPQIVIKDNRVLPAQPTQQYPSIQQGDEEEVVEYIHNPNVIQ